ncbi:MAG: DUF2188 domain-containing protein [Phenylobacterium sp.]|uniref:DUF2188 domain-containing protein n=1 Tax=Phenylobacterium sp. TaxID=1871053 RepID=UPI00121F70B6|nr:DUF2188 domain-containing protein [Phenylobacterium sp.]TAJ68993.1 MAG: DUF2188 domain-containing protein [Phenylobacterium sp.]
MTNVVYHVVEHDGGWAYQVDGSFSETFPTHEAAHKAAARAAAEQRQPGQTEGIVYEDKTGKWREEVSSGDDRPDTSVDD